MLIVAIMQISGLTCLADLIIADLAFMGTALFHAIVVGARREQVNRPIRRKNSG